MKAFVFSEYGLPDVLHLQEVDQPAPKENEVLIKMMAVSINASDWEFLTGRPLYIRLWGLFKPKYHILGSDIAGIVADVGRNVTKFKPGDAVFGDIFEQWGGLAEYVCAPADKLLGKPDAMTFVQAAALPQASTVAMQGLRDAGKIMAGQKVLINGAGGGAGSYAIQLAKYFGAEVTGVDSSAKQEIMRTLGADYVVDFQQADFTQSGRQYDLILDLAASHSIFDYKRSLAPNGRYVMVGGTLAHLFGTLIIGSMLSLTGSRQLGILAHQPNKNLADIVALVENGQITPAVDCCFPLEETRAAFHHFGSGQVKGKMVITIGEFS